MINISLNVFSKLENKTKFFFYFLIKKRWNGKCWTSMMIEKKNIQLNEIIKK